MWNKQRLELLKPVSKISGLKYFNALVQDRVIFVGQLYLRHEGELLTLPRFGKNSISVINQHLNERGFSEMPKVSPDILLRKEFIVAASSEPNLRLARLGQDMEEFLKTDEYRDLRNGFSRFVGANKDYFMGKIVNHSTLS